jgi:hypothetical protein
MPCVVSEHVLCVCCVCRKRTRWMRKSDQSWRGGRWRSGPCMSWPGCLSATAVPAMSLRLELFCTLAVYFCTLMVYLHTCIKWMCMCRLCDGDFTLSGWKTFRIFWNFCFHLREIKAGVSSECLCFQNFFLSYAFRIFFLSYWIFSTLCSPPCFMYSFVYMTSFYCCTSVCRNTPLSRSGTWRRFPLVSCRPCSRPWIGTDKSSMSLLVSCSSVSTTSTRGTVVFSYLCHDRILFFLKYTPKNKISDF